MKALSLTQPWATLIAIGAKRIETRSWPTRHRGVVAIHAAKGFPDDARLDCWDEPFKSALKDHVDFGYYSDLSTDADERFFGLPRGAIVATCDLVECFLTGDTLNYQFSSRTLRAAGGYDYTITPTEIAFGNYAPGRFGWVLKNILPLPSPIPCRGALGLWTVPAEIEAAIRSASKDVVAV